MGTGSMDQGHEGLGPWALGPAQRPRARGSVSNHIHHDKCTRGKCLVSLSALDILYDTFHPDVYSYPSLDWGGFSAYSPVCRSVNVAKAQPSIVILCCTRRDFLLGQGHNKRRKGSPQEFGMFHQFCCAGACDCPFRLSRSSVRRPNHSR